METQLADSKGEKAKLKDKIESSILGFYTKVIRYGDLRWLGHNYPEALVDAFEEIMREGRKEFRDNVDEEALKICLELEDIDRNALIRGTELKAVKATLWDRCLTGILLSLAPRAQAKLLLLQL